MCDSIKNNPFLGKTPEDRVQHVYNEWEPILRHVFEEANVSCDENKLKWLSQYCHYHAINEKLGQNINNSDEIDYIYKQWAPLLEDHYKKLGITVSEEKIKSIAQYCHWHAINERQSINDKYSGDGSKFESYLPGMLPLLSEFDENILKNYQYSLVPNNKVEWSNKMEDLYEIKDDTIIISGKNATTFLREFLEEDNCLDLDEKCLAEQISKRYIDSALIIDNTEIDLNSLRFVFKIK